MDRDSFITATITSEMVGLEIGPSYSPRFSKSAGWKVETVDHTTADELRKKYASLAEAASIEEVDYVWPGGPLTDAVPGREKYDFIYASHVVEHIIDLIGFFQSCEQLLKPDGKLVLVVPDKRQCFDFLRPITSVGDLLESLGSSSSKHRAGRLFDFFAYTADLGGNTIWNSDWAYDLKLKPSFACDIPDAFARYTAAVESPDYYDIHSWIFVPSSFRLIMKDLNSCGVIKLKESQFFSTQTCEFYFSASLSGMGCSLSRMELHKNIAREQIGGLSQIIAT